MAKNSKSTQCCEGCECKEIYETKDLSQQAYFKVVFDTETPEKKRVTAALAEAHETRRFEIGLYWQRSLFFWGFNALFFAGFMMLFDTVTDKDEPKTILVYWMLFGVAVLGVFTSGSWYFIETASRSWQKNWEQHINFLELPITGNLHKSIIGKRDEFYALHKIHTTFIGVIGSVWLILSGVGAYEVVKSPQNFLHFANWGFWIGFAILILTYATLLLAFALLTGRSCCEIIKPLIRKLCPCKMHGYWKTSPATMPTQPAFDVIVKDKEDECQWDSKEGTCKNDKCKRGKCTERLGLRQRELPEVQ